MLFDQFKPGTLAKVAANPKDDGNNVRRKPEIPEKNRNSNVIGTIPVGELMVVLEPPHDWSKSYPHQANGYTWVHVYAPRAERPGKARGELVGWTAIGPNSADKREDLYLVKVYASQLAS